MEIFTEKLGDDFRKNCEMIDSLLRVDKSFDIIKREMKIAGANCVMYYIDGFVKAELMQKLMVYLISVKEIGDGGKDAAYTFAARRRSRCDRLGRQYNPHGSFRLYGISQ